MHYPTEKLSSNNCAACFRLLFYKAEVSRRVSGISLISVVVVSQRRCLQYNYFGDRIVFLNKHGFLFSL